MFIIKVTLFTEVTPGALYHGEGKGSSREAREGKHIQIRNTTNEARENHGYSN